MANNYTPSYKQYLTQTAGYALPSSVRTYSVFDPNSNSWRRMTNDGMSPIPAQGQTPVADALALARQTQGRDWSAQTPLGGPTMASPASGRGTAVVPMGQGRNVSPRASQGQIPVLPGEDAVQAPSTLYQGSGKTPDGREIYSPIPAVNTSNPTVPVYPVFAPNQNEANAEVAQMFQQPTPKFNQWGEVLSPEAAEWRRKRDLLGQGFKNAALIGSDVAQGYYGAGLLGAGARVLTGALASNAARRQAARAAAAQATEKAETAAHYAASQANRAEMMNILRAQGRMGLSAEEQALAQANRFGPAQSEWISPTTPSVGAGLSRSTANYTSPRAPRALDPMRKVTTYVPTPETPVQIIRPLVNTPASSARLALPPGTGAIPMGRNPTIIRTPLEMTTPSGLARWQYRLDQLSGLGR